MHNVKSGRFSKIHSGSLRVQKQDKLNEIKEE